MRTIPVLLLALALLAGCVRPLADEPLDTASTATAPAEEDMADPSASDAPAPAASSPASSPAASSSSPSSAASTGPPPPAPPTPPPPPAPIAWNLSSEASLGYVAAVGAGPATQKQADPDHCPDATFTLPAQTATLRFVVDASPVEPGESAGAYDIIITSADGNATRLQPVMDAANTVPAGEPTEHGALVVEAPAAGVWSLHAEPVGPTFQQTWVVFIEANGESVAPPTQMLVTSTCS